MAAHDKFESFIASLSSHDRSQLHDFILDKREEILAARSEDARVRLVSEYIKEIHEKNLLRRK